MQVRRAQAWPCVAVVVATVGVTASLGAVALAAEPPASKVVSFVACPIYRDADSGRKSGCWLADAASTGIRYDISLGIAKPQIGHEVLVEGIVVLDADSSRARACGGVVLEPVRTSTLEPSCVGALIPAEGFPGRRYVSDPTQVLPQTWVERSDVKPSTSGQRYSIVFDFGSSFLNYQYSEVILDRVARTAIASNARNVEITGFAVSDGYAVSGRTLREPVSLARERAEIVAEALRRLDVSAKTIKVQWRTDVAALDQPLREASRRRADIVLNP
jgi:outer membrane protein OmpA-like peptidoglycan-associated protein